MAEGWLRDSGAIILMDTRGDARSLSEVKQISLHWYAFVVIGSS